MEHDIYEKIGTKIIFSRLFEILCNYVFYPYLQKIQKPLTDICLYLNDKVTDLGPSPKQGSIRYEGHFYKGRHIK